MAKETYKQARERLLAELPQFGWKTKPTLKVPQAITPNGHTVYFRTQATYLDEHSLFIDIRNMSVNDLMNKVSAALVLKEQRQ